MTRANQRRFIITRHGGRYKDVARIVAGDNSECVARTKYETARDKLRQGSVALVDTDASEIIAVCGAPNLRTRW